MTGNQTIPPAGPSRKRQKRCVRACNNCKRKKDRCDGQLPCDLCSKRGHTCEYSSIAAKDLTSDSKAIDALKLSKTSLAPEAPVPRTARFLGDGSGRYNYIGDSASLSFLQSASLVVKSLLGECDFTSNEHLLVSPSVERSSFHSQRNITLPSIDPDRAEYLANEYLMATGCLLDLFDAESLTADIRRWAVDPGISTDIHECCLLLVLSIGLQVDSKAAQDDIAADAFFSRGRQLAYEIMADEPSILIVQAFALIGMYLMGHSRADAAFMNLGIAIRGADTLGLHRTDQATFSGREALARERAWRSIRVLDIFLSASTGRPPATTDLDKDSNTEASVLETTIGPDELFSRSTRGLCAIGERILVEVYKERSVSTARVEKISQQIREWVSMLPRMPAALETQTRSADHQEMSRIMASAHLMGAYYWAIILLTRPFLLFHVSMQSGSSLAYPSVDKTKTLISNIAEACIVAALNGLELVEDVLACDRLPRKLPVVLNSVLNCALAIGIAVFADYDDHFPLIPSLHRSISALEKLGRTDAAALHYLQTIQSFAAAANAYRVQRQNSELQKKNRQFDALFGAVDPRFASSASQARDSSASAVYPANVAVPQESHYSDFWYDDEYATIYPSGLLLGGANIGQDVQGGPVTDPTGPATTLANARLDSNMFG